MKSQGKRLLSYRNITPTFIFLRLSNSFKNSVEHLEMSASNHWILDSLGVLLFRTCYLQEHPKKRCGGEKNHFSKTTSGTITAWTFSLYTFFYKDNLYKHIHVKGLQNVRGFSWDYMFCTATTILILML